MAHGPTRRALLALLSALGVRSAQGGEPVTVHVPDEAARHLCTFMQWPANRAVHPDGAFLSSLQDAVARIANAIVAFEPVVMLAAAEHHSAARRRLSASVELWDVPTDDLWCRDSGPVFGFDRHGAPVVTRIQFNGWGAKQTCDADAQVASRVARRLGLPIVDHGLFGEAGGVETDGDGTLIAHESCWIDPGRNAGSKEDVTRRCWPRWARRP